LANGHMKEGDIANNNPYSLLPTPHSPPHYSNGLLTDCRFRLQKASKRPLRKLTPTWATAHMVWRITAHTIIFPWLGSCRGTSVPVKRLFRLWQPCGRRTMAGRPRYCPRRNCLPDSTRKTPPASLNPLACG